MASLTGVCRASARLLAGRSAARGFTTSARCLAAQNFSMPALSPTMTEGNIATWKVKEGDSFSAGDVLLEIETDKATMDVEAQDDGVMVKIMTGDGSKSVQVGTRIAVVAEPGDDIASLEIPADEQQSKQQSPKQESAPATQEQKPQEKKASAPKPTGDDTFQHRYPFYPSVGHLVKEHGLSEDQVNQIKPTGPGGRLLKGDVLAYLGSIKADSPAAVSARFEKLSHLDLSNIKVAPKKEAPKKADDAAPAAPKAPAVQTLELKVPVSMAKVLEVQKKINKTLGVFLPISTFISRAADVANTELPLPARAPTADELFDQLLGLDKLKATASQGFYLPQISAIPPASLLAAQPSTPKKQDIIDILAAPSKKPVRPRGIPTVPGLSSGDNVFSLVVPKSEEARAKTFLERCKVILEEEPGRLVL